MDWLNSVRRHLTNSDRRVRSTGREISVAQVEVLEERAVLGALAPLPTSETPTTLSSGSSSETVASSSTPPAAPTTPPPTAETTPPAPTTTTTTETSLVDASAEDQQMTFDEPEASPHSSAPATESSSGESLDPSVTMASESAPAADSGTNSSTTTAADSAPPQELDATTDQPPGNVFVDNETMADYEFSKTNIPWWDSESQPVVIKYDFRTEAGYENEITEEQIAAAEQALQAWSDASGGRITWVRDTEAAAEDIVNIGVGDLGALGYNSSAEGTLGISKSKLDNAEGGGRTVIGTIWLDNAETWDNAIGNGNPAGTKDFFTVFAHEAGHTMGLEDDLGSSIGAAMNPQYLVERGIAGIAEAYKTAIFFPRPEPGSPLDGYAVHNLGAGFPQLTQVEVGQLLDRASAASASQDAIIAIVDRNGIILGVRVEQDVLNTIVDPAVLAFAIDGAVAKARSACFFSSNAGPITSRTVRNLSQTTITQREVQGNPNITDPNSTIRGPGFVAPIGLGAHFPADVTYTPPVDLFAIEHTNRDSFSNPGADNIKGTADDIDYLYRLNINPAFVPAGQTIVPPLAYGEQRYGSADLAQANNSSFQGRGIATLPGGLGIYRDTDGNGLGDTLIAGIGVFFPGADGYATFEQGFVNGVGQTSLERTNAPKVLEAEYIAFAALGGSRGAAVAGAAGAVVGDIAGIPPVAGLDLLFGHIALVGINLEIYGPRPGVNGVRDLLNLGIQEGVSSGANQEVLAAGVTVQGGGVVGAATLLDGQAVASGTLVTPHNSAVPGGLTAADVQQIINQGIAGADVTRSAIRLDADFTPGARSKMVIAITDTTGEVLGLFRMDDSLVDALEVTVAKARNAAYYADAAKLALHPEDQVAGLPPGTAVTGRTFRFLAGPRYPDGVDLSPPGPWSILQDAGPAGIDPLTGENIGAAAPASLFDSVLGFDSFNPQTNFRDDSNLANRSGVAFFPGSIPLYKNGVLVGGLGVSGDGVDQNDVVTFLAAQGFLPDGVTTQRADQTAVNGVRLPFLKFNRNPFG